MKYILLALFLFSGLTVLANPVPDFPFVIVTETIEQQVKPDSAKVEFDILAYETTSDMAMEQLTNVSAQMLEILEKHDIPLSRIATSQVNKRVRRAKNDDTNKFEILGYELQQNFNLEITDLDKYSSVMNELIRLDGVQSINALFETSKEDEYKEQMIVELSDKVREKADALARGQSRKVKSVYGITTESNFGQAYAIFSLEYKTRFLSMSASFDRGLVMSVPEFIKVDQQITAIYELELE